VLPADVFPGGHLEHEDAPDNDVYWPSKHKTQVDSGPPKAYDPLEQRRQLPTAATASPVGQTVTVLAAQVTGSGVDPNVVSDSSDCTAAVESVRMKSWHSELSELSELLELSELTELTELPPPPPPG
jgi:hypothetical protein